MKKFIGHMFVKNAEQVTIEKTFWKSINLIVNLMKILRKPITTKLNRSTSTRSKLLKVKKAMILKTKRYLTFCHKEMCKVQTWITGITALVKSKIKRLIVNRTKFKSKLRSLSNLNPKQMQCFSLTKVFSNRKFWTRHNLNKKMPQLCR